MATTTEAGNADTSAGGWYIGWGVLLIVCGIIAILMPEIAALATALIFAWLLILGGVFEIAYAFQTRTREGFGWKIASGILTLVLGIAIGWPQSSVAFIGLLTGFTLISTGLWRILLRHPLPA